MAKGRRTFKALSKTANLKNLRSKYKVKKMERVIQGLRDIKNRSELLEHVKGIRAKHFRRKIRDLREENIPNLHNIYLISLDENADVEAICKEYKKDPNVEYAEPNYIAYTTETIPNDPDFFSSGVFIIPVKQVGRKMQISMHRRLGISKPVTQT